MAAVLYAAPAAEGAVKAGDRPETVILEDLAGARVALPVAYVGKVVVVHFWASWCPSCLREIDALEALFGEGRGRDFVPVSVNVGETKAIVTESLRNRKTTYPILLDSDSKTARLYGVHGFPTTFVLKRDGSIGLKVLGEIDRDGLRRILSGML